MKNLVLSAALLIGITSCDVRRTDKIAETVPVNASTVTDISTVPPTSIQMIDTTYNFGTVAEGAIVEFSFRFKNTGDKPLIVQNASASCGCTVPEKPEQPVMPGETSFIKVKFNTEGKPNQAHKTVNIVSNARPEFPVLALVGMVTPKNQ